jgi:hypothetical protein
MDYTIDAYLGFGKYNGYLLSELYQTWDGRNYMIYIMKHFEDMEIVDCVSNYYGVMKTPLSFFEYFESDLNGDIL